MKLLNELNEKQPLHAAIPSITNLTFAIEQVTHPWITSTSGIDDCHQLSIG